MNEMPAVAAVAVKVIVVGQVDDVVVVEFVMQGLQERMEECLRQTWTILRMVRQREVVEAKHLSLLLKEQVALEWSSVEPGQSQMTMFL